MNISQPKRRPGRPATGKDPMRSMRVSEQEWEEWKHAAAQADVTLSKWMRDILNRAAQRAKRAS